jgi:hypothetical protein
MEIVPSFYFKGWREPVGGSRINKEGGRHAARAAQIDKKSLFGTPGAASARTGRNHAGIDLTQRSHGEEHGRSGDKRQAPQDFQDF